MEPITADEVFGTAIVKGDPKKVRPITAQDVIDHIPNQPALQPQVVDGGGQPLDATALDNATSVTQVPRDLRVEQRPTGPDQNVLPGNAGFGANLKANFVEDPQTKINIYAKALFPNDPNAAKRFGVREGRVVFIDEEGNLRDVEHGAGSRTGTALAYSPEVAGSVIGSFATGNPVSGGALGGAAGKGLKQIIAGTLLDDPQTTTGNLEGMAGEALINLASGGVAKGAGKFVNKGKVVDFTPEELGAAQKLAAKIESDTGIKLDLSQASSEPVLMALRKYAAKFPGPSSKIFRELDETQTGQTAQAMQKLLDGVAKEMSSDAAGKSGINAAQKAISDARAGVSKEVKPLYDAAYAAVPEVTDKKILGMLELGPFKKALGSAKELAELEGVDSTKPSLQMMDYVKRGLDDQISAAKQGGQRQLARALSAKRSEFVEALDALPNQEWQAARKAYGKAAKERIEPLENGAIGALAKITDQKAATAASKMFTDPNITAKEIAFARNAIEKADPEAWNQLTRQYLASNLNRALKVTQQGETRNLAGKLYQSMAGTPEQLSKLRAALPTASQGALDDVLAAFKLVAATERAGSDTAFNQLLTKKIEGKFSGAIKWLRQPVQQIIQAGEEKQLAGMVTKLAEGLTDSAKISQLKQVTKAPPSLNRALQIVSTLGITPYERKGRNAIDPLPDTPIPAQESRP